jgi:chromosome segregation ATPase
MKFFFIAPALLLLTACTTTWPWQKTREELKGEIASLNTRLDNNGKLLQETQDLVKKQKESAAASQVADNRKEDVSQAAAEHVNNIVTIAKVLPPKTRKDEVIFDEAQCAARALPPAKDNHLGLMQKLLDEKLTTINELNQLHKQDLDDIDQLNKAKVEAEKVAEEKKQEVEQKTAQVNETKAKLQATNNDLNTARSLWEKSKDFIATIRNWLAGIFIVISIAIGVLGWFTGKFITVAKAAVGLVGSVLLLLVPSDYYLIALLVGLGALIVYTIIHHLTIHQALSAAKDLETKVANASIGTIHEMKEEISDPAVAQKVADIESEWHRDVDGMGNIVKTRLEELNLVAKK